MKQYIVDAFTDKLFAGNQAAVCVMDEWISDELMQNIAKENNLSETAFTVKEGEVYHLRWFTPAGEGQFRLWPHKLLGEGHFAAVLRKIGDGESDETAASKEKLPKEWQEFAKELDISLPEGKPVQFGQSLYWAPEEMPDIRGIRVLRPGLELGEVRKGRFEPAHALALWLKTCNNTETYSADSEEMKSYIHGDVVPSQKKGWCLVCADSYSIGWGKGDGRVLKNHYPKGLRR